MNISPAEEPERRDAFALLNGKSPDDASVTRSLALIASGELDPSGLIVARSRGILVSAVFARSQPGGTGLIIPARAVGDAAGVLRALTAVAIRHLAHEKVIQAFLKPEEMNRGQALLDNGFQHVTRLLEMRKTTEIAAGFRLSGSLRILPYSQAEPVEFQEILARVHEDSLDCPELDRARTREQMYEGYCQSSPDKSRWLLAKCMDEAVGVVLLADNELSLLGVVPEWRRHGVGRFLLDAACRLERSLVLTVDARNTPAIQLYASFGFEVVGGHEVFLNFPSPLR